MVFLCLDNAYALWYFIGMNPECPTPNPECDGCPKNFIDRHHLYGRPPQGIARRFANLPENIVEIRRCEHDELHATVGVFDLPSIEVMKRCVQDEINRRKRIAKGGE